MRIQAGCVCLAMLVWILAAGCSGSSSVAPSPAPPSGPGPITTPPAAPATFVGAGDIADCSTLDGGANAEATARLIDRITDAVVFTAGDNAYFDGSAAEFQN